MDQLKQFTGPAWGRFIIYFVLLVTGLGLGALAAWGFGTFTKLPDGEWAYSVTVTSTQLASVLGIMVAGGGSGVLAMLKGFRTRVGDIPAAERVGDKPISGPTVDTVAVKVK